MAWNEPGGNKQDPWGGSGREQGPPDLDDLIRKLTNRFGGIFKGRSGGSGSGTGGGANIKGLGLLAAVVVVGWLLSGIYIVEQGKRGVVLRFGKYVDTTQPGPHWRIPYPVDEVEIVDVEIRRVVEIGYRSAAAGARASNRTVPREALMLTQDENVVDIRLAVQYQISNPAHYLFNVLDPDFTLKQVVESATRQVIGKSKMDFVLTEGRSEVVALVKELSQMTLEKYEAGLQIVNVNLQDAQPPEEVQAAFADAIKAREDEQRFKNEAEAYANEVVPRARGGAARQLEEANAYKAQVVASAEGEAQRFEDLLTEYLKAPRVTRERLYLDAMEEVMAANRKVLVDTSKGDNLLYLPLDQLGAPGTGMRRSATSSSSVLNAGAAASGQRARDQERGRDSGRQREIR